MKKSNSEPRFELVDITKIELPEYNPRDISKEDFKKLRDDIRKDPNFLMQRPPLLNYNTKTKSMLCYAGFQRINAATANGLKRIHCWIENNVPRKQQDERMIKDNMHRGQWDLAKLMKFDSALLLDSGFKAEDLNAMFTGLLELREETFDFDQEVAKIKKPKTKAGDIYQLGKHRLICGDSCDGVQWEKLMSGKKAALQLTDPPYNVDYTGKTSEKLKIDNDKMSDSNFIEFLTSAFSSAGKHLRDGGASYIFHADTFGLQFRNAFIAAGNKLAQCLVWVKNSLVMGRQDYHWKHEPIIYGWKEGAKHYWFSDRKQSTVINFDRPIRNEDHPTMKPVELISYLMTNSSAINDIVIDGFLGSGTTLIAAEQLKRVCYGMELDPIYCDVIVKRWEEISGKKAKLIR